jgi:demethylmenaquinone methyltransferase / 2-methoxy-6-polyprenyl-1,4-benzoquinol methylase
LNHRELFVQRTFDQIARRYDLLNRVISFHLDTVWRRKAVSELALEGKESYVLDLGTGTGDLALTTAKFIGKKGKVFGLDLSHEMIRLAQSKKQKEGFERKIFYLIASALMPPFKANSFDGIVTAFVLRNVIDLKLFFQNAYDLLKPGGRVVSLDMFPPQKYPFSFFYSLYFYCLVPWIGAGLARNHDAYRYLADSVKRFCPPETVSQILEQTGFSGLRVRRYLGGAVCLHSAAKPFRSPS